MLGRYCGSCHGAAAVANGTVAAFDSVDDLDEMVERGYIIPFNSAASPLVQRVRKGDMPPASVMPRPSQSEIRALESFVSTGGLSF
jgi:mono/diheme cytochrome c family protein